MNIKEAQQSIFDQIMAHLRKQKRQSLNPGGWCAYRGPTGRMCAIGPFITNYTEDMENGLPIDGTNFPMRAVSLRTKECQKRDKKIWDALTDEARACGSYFLLEAQSSLHDSYDKVLDVSFSKWLEKQGKIFAACWNLTFPEKNK